MSPICPKPASTAQNVSSGVRSTTAKTCRQISLQGCVRTAQRGCGNRQLNAAIHRIALSQARCHPDARALLTRRKVGGDGGMEALRNLKRRLPDVVFKAMAADLSLMVTATAA